MNIYDFIDDCRDNGLDATEAVLEWDRYQAEERERRYDEYMNDPEVQYGWYQQDIIDMRTRER